MVPKARMVLGPVTDIADSTPILNLFTARWLLYQEIGPAVIGLEDQYSTPSKQREPALAFYMAT